MYPQRIPKTLCISTLRSRVLSRNHDNGHDRPKKKPKNPRKRHVNDTQTHRGSGSRFSQTDAQCAHITLSLYN